MKHVLTVQDLSCVGRCSLTVALPVLSAMGVRTSVLPTAILSTHTAFPNPEVVSLTAQMESFAAHWEKQDVRFDAISVGYLSDPIQAEAVLRITEKFPCPVILDPVMGDNGRLYSRITAEHIRAMQELCARADVILPNLTEAAFLTGSEYRPDPEESYLAQLADKLLALGAKNVVITGIRWEDGTIGWYFSDGSRKEIYRDTCVPRSFHGTGDLFAAVFAGDYVNRNAIPQAAARAAKFVKRCVEATETVTPFGVEFESQLPLLCEDKV